MRDSIYSEHKQIEQNLTTLRVIARIFQDLTKTTTMPLCPDACSII